LQQATISGIVAKLQLAGRGKTSKLELAVTQPIKNFEKSFAGY
jgi:hypothetical protein